jgi:hypothetical protein
VKRRHTRFQFRQIDPAGDLTGVLLNDCNSILRKNVCIDLSADELKLIQLFDRLLTVEALTFAVVNWPVGYLLGVLGSRLYNKTVHPWGMRLQSSQRRPSVWP